MKNSNGILRKGLTQPVSGGDTLWNIASGGQTTKRIATLFAAAFIFFSCTDLQTANEEVAKDTSPTVEQFGAGQQVDMEPLPVPDPEAYKDFVTLTKGKAAGAKLYNLVLVHPKGEVPGSNGAPVVDNFVDAVERVKSGGMIKVFAGEYVLNEIVVVDRAVTIEPMGGTSPVIRNTGAHAFMVTGDHEGLVTFRGLTFENAGGPGHLEGHSSVFAQGSEVLITDSDFNAVNGYANVFGGGGAKLTIEKSSFTNGAVGTFSSGMDTEMYVHSSSFSGHRGVAVQHQLGAGGIVANNTMTDCGVSGCARAIIDTKVDMLGNRFSDDIANVNGFNHHIVMYWISSGKVSGNLFDGCGHGQCIGGINKTVLEISDNEFRIYEEHHTRFVIVGSDGTLGNNPYGREVDLLVTDNVINGIGGNYQNDPGNPDAYAIKLGGLLIENYGRMKAHRNTIVNANMGISVLSGGVLTEARDNKIQHVRAAVAAYDLFGLGQSSASLQSNDFTGYETSILNDSFDSGSDLTCNWWGTVAGPQNMQGAQSSVSISTPWATGPVAGSSVTSCSGGI